MYEWGSSISGPDAALFKELWAKQEDRQELWEKQESR